MNVFLFRRVARRGSIPGARPDSLRAPRCSATVRTRSSTLEARNGKKRIVTITNEQQVTVSIVGPGSKPALTDKDTLPSRSRSTR